jgi:hypothetical protein
MTTKTSGELTKTEGLSQVMDRIATFREPTDAERKAMAAAEARAPDRPARLATKSEEVNGKLIIVSPHSDPWGFVDQLRDTLGSSSDAFCGQLVTRLDPILRDVGSTRATDNQVNAALAVMGAVAPQNELEAIIGEQIIGAHTLSVEMMHQAMGVSTHELREAYVGMATKLSRTMAAQVDTLSRLRSGGKQQVIVKHVYINGNAVVGDNARTVQQASGGGFGQGCDPSNNGQSHAAEVFDALGPPMRGEDALGLAVSLTGGSGPEKVPHARWHEPRRAHRRGQRSVPNRPSHPQADERQVHDADDGAHDQAGR